MDIGFSSLIFILYSLLLIQCLQITEARLMNDDHKEDNHLRFRTNQDEEPVYNSDKSSSYSNMDPALKIFFHHKDLKVGNKMQVYFPTKDPSTSPRLLSKHESDSIPFISSKLPNILKFFSFPEESKQALAIKATLNHCESPPIKGETKFCATSLELMLDSVRRVFGLDSRFKVLTTSYLTQLASPLQNYTISETPVEIPASKIVACHPLPYPYAVFYCHGQVSDNMLYKVSLVAEDGGRVAAAAMCHMDTSQWDPDHVAFGVLKTTPGASPVCHYFPADNLVWIPAS